MKRRPLRALPAVVLASALTCTVGCSLSRPTGAYDPPITDDDNSAFLNPDSGTDNSNNVIPHGGDDASSNPPGEGGVVSPLAVLADRYMMRLDSYSSVNSTKDNNEVDVDVRVSHLMVVDLDLQPDGTLLGTETLCDRSYLTECGRLGCKSWSTTLSPKVAARFTRQVKRTYQLDAQGRLVAGPGAHALGFDPDPSDPTVGADDSTPVPTSTADAWNIDTSASAPLYGMATLIDASLYASSLGPISPPVSVSCKVMSAERLGFTFMGAIDPSDPNTLDTPGGIPASFRADINWPANTLLVQGDPTYCTADQLNATHGDNEVHAIRFKRAHDLVGCPNDGGDFITPYERAFPGNATAPTAFR